MYIVLILVLKKRPSQETGGESPLQQRPPTKSHLHAVHVVVKTVSYSQKTEEHNLQEKREKNTSEPGSDWSNAINRPN